MKYREERVKSLNTLLIFKCSWYFRYYVFSSYFFRYSMSTYFFTDRINTHSMCLCTSIQIVFSVIFIYNYKYTICSAIIKHISPMIRVHSYNILITNAYSTYLQLFNGFYFIKSVSLQSQNLIDKWKKKCWECMSSDCF